MRCVFLFEKREDNKMKVLVLMGSPRLHGNTAELCKPFMEELIRQGAREFERRIIEQMRKNVI